MDRTVSTSSSAVTDASVEIPSISNSINTELPVSDVYLYALKLIILDYINEPRFMDTVLQSSKTEVSRVSSDKSNHQKHGERILVSKQDDISEHEIVQAALRILKGKLAHISGNKSLAPNEMHWKSIVKMYYSMLDSSSADAFSKMSQIEEVVGYFTNVASNELKKLAVESTRDELFSEVAYFIDLVIDVLPDSCANIIKRLLDYKISLKKGEAIGKKKKTTLPATVPQYRTISGGTSNSKQPSFKVQDISHMKYFMQLFNVDETKLQKDVIAVKDESTNPIFCGELRYLRRKIKKDSGFLTSSDFTNDRHYTLWKNYELLEIANLMDRFGTGEKVTSHGNRFIPKDAKSVFVHLISLVLKKECSSTVNAINLSQEALFFLHKSARYWRIENPSTLSSLVYSAANLSILDDEELNIPITENLFSVIRNKYLCSEDNLDPSTWNTPDRYLWAANLFYTTDQSMRTINNLLTAIFSSTKPKFSPVLSFYYSNVVEDPVMDFFEVQASSIKKGWVKLFKKTLFKTAENYFISLLQNMLKGNTVEIQNVQTLVETIIDAIKAIQKRYSKPLLDEISLPRQCAIFLCEVYGSDSLKLLKTAEKNCMKTTGESLGPIDALDMYDVLKELRHIYIQVKPKGNFFFNLEDYFIKYLTQLCDDVSRNVLKVIKTTIESENWQPINDQDHFSRSVLDIFKMINESTGMFEKFGWENELQLAHMITVILKAFSDGMLSYSTQVMTLIERDLLEGDEPSYSIENSDSQSSLNLNSTDPNHERSRGSRLFEDLKNVVKSTPKIVAPAPYQFKKRTCVLLNDLDKTLFLLENFEEKADPSRISSIIAQCQSSRKPDDNRKLFDDQNMKQVYTVRIIGADNIKGFSKTGLSNSYVSMRNITLQREIGTTNIVARSISPKWDEEFVFESPFGRSNDIMFTVWHHPHNRLKNLAEDDLCGKASMKFTPRKLKDDGFPVDFSLTLSPQGTLYCQISLESEKVDAVSSMGRIYRSFSRSRDRAINLIVSKFSNFIAFAFSRTTLKTVCGHHGTILVSDDAVYDAILPLFDYLNANLSILASELSQRLLFMVMLRAWNLVLENADLLLLPSLNSAKTNILRSAKRSLWENTISSTKTVSGYGRPLTQAEIEAIFKWLGALCIDFFHNKGEGPPLAELKNEHYQNILLIPAFYDKSISELKEEVKRLIPVYEEYLKWFYLKKTPITFGSKSGGTISRKESLSVNIVKEPKQQLERDAEVMNIILRILIAKGQHDYVHHILHDRKDLVKIMKNRRAVSRAVNSTGKKGRT
ncbi:YOR296W [Saccharomyces arboricola H-6]|uniref:YOR296W n=1 Tax=Saccharomyces arboricola (strain H-6 / AS 2.3317 / CBS 10644) TaxID=1160507 RepID=J8PHP6_SACAR|nr:YOR296W [Saccharomyces arboricola H-6]